MKKTSLAIFLILSIFFFANKAISIIIADKDKQLFEEMSANPQNNMQQKAIPINVVIMTIDPKVELGKKLFFDPILSKTGKISCASCHRPDHGFADDKSTSEGINGQQGDRNTPTVFNTVNLKFLFWDGRAQSLEEQALGPIKNPKEMGETVKGVLAKLNKDPQYVKEFSQVFGQTPISTSQLVHAIADYERTIISKDSDYDKYIAGNKKALPDSAKRGMDLFFDEAMCVAFHKGSDFTDGDVHNIGLPITDDVGRSAISITGKDTRKFKTPTLREVANTAPYFHKGQFETLEAVIAFYNAGGGQDDYKDPLKKPLNLNDQEQKDLVEFLKSLSGR